MKNDLIKKLDNEKQNLIEEIKNISNKIEKVKEFNKSNKNSTYTNKR